MRSAYTALGPAVLLLAAFTACEPQSHPIEPGEVPTFAVGGDGRTILMLDQCEPESFNAAIGPGTCVNRNGGITIDVFINQLVKHQRVASWRFSPAVINVPRTMTLPIVNRGGEPHTFTPVQEFGGGFIPELNELSGTPDPAPECLALSFADLVPSGGHVMHTFTPGVEEKFMCCLHPWMRAVSR